MRAFSKRNVMTLEDEEDVVIFYISHIFWGFLFTNFSMTLKKSLLYYLTDLYNLSEYN